MKNRSAFAFNEYKALLKSYLLGTDNRGQLSRAAESLNCQKSYLSRVITGNAHLTLDQAYLLSRFLKFSHDEREYLSALVEVERAASLDYRNFIKNLIHVMKKKHESIQERTQRKEFVTDNLQLNYFSSWISCALQFLTMIPEYQNRQALSERLGLKKEMVLNFLKQLEVLKLVENKKDRWVNISSNFHIPKESPLVLLHHQNWRQRALLDAQNFASDHVHFTGVYTLSKEDFQRIKDMLLSFIEEANQIIGPSSCEEGIALTLDLFRI